MQKYLKNNVQRRGPKHGPIGSKHWTFACLETGNTNSAVYIHKGQKSEMIILRMTVFCRKIIFILSSISAAAGLTSSFCVNGFRELTAKSNSREKRKCHKWVNVTAEQCKQLCELGKVPRSCKADACRRWRWISSLKHDGKCQLFASCNTSETMMANTAIFESERPTPWPTTSANSEEANCIRLETTNRVGHLAYTVQLANKEYVKYPQRIRHPGWRAIHCFSESIQKIYVRNVANDIWSGRIIATNSHEMQQLHCPQTGTGLRLEYLHYPLLI